MGLNGVFTNCSKLVPCPVCRATDRCSIIRARGIVNCRTPEANDGEPRTAADGSRHWTHHLGRGAASLVIAAPDGVPVAEAAKLDQVYRALLVTLSQYGPTDKHRRDLERRGFDLAAMREGLYQSVPDAKLKAEIAAQMVAVFGEDLCRQVPGFVAPVKEGEPWKLAGPPGLFIPVRNAANQIVSLKIRRDEPDDDGSRYCTFSSAFTGGPTALRGVHFPYPRYLDARRARITEGELKADIVQHATQMNTLSLPGVGAWAMAAPALRALDEHGAADNSKARVKVAVIAFDADRMRKATVALCQRELVADLREKGFEVEIEVWPEAAGKGLDDLLLKGGTFETLAGEAVDAHVATCCEACGIRTLREEMEIVVAAVVEAKSLLPVTESDAWLTLVSEVFAEAPREYEWLKSQVDAVPLKSWRAGFERVLRAHQAERRAAESEACVKNEDAGGLATIEVYDRNIRDIGKDALQALVAGNAPPSLFRQGERLVSLVKDGEKCTPVEMGQGDLLGRLDDSANWVESKGKRPVFVYCPPRVAQYLLAGDRDYAPFPEIRGIVGTPCFDREGNLICTPGYHAASGLFYQPRGKLEIDFREGRLPTPEEFAHAKGWIEEYMFRTMPFDCCGSHAMAWSYFLVPFVREMIDGPTPLHVINAPKEGTGKGLLNFICTQAFVPGGPVPKGEIGSKEEWGKLLLGVLQEGESHLYFDNVNGKVDSGVLALCLTERAYANRKLGTNSMVSVPIRTIWCMSGNNVELSSEIARRAPAWLSLDANSEDPALLDYGPLPLKEFLAANRSSAVAHALTCIRWWLAHDCPLWRGKRPGSYERWAEVMGGILAVCEVEGFLENQRAAISDHSGDTLGWRCFVSEWWQKFGEEEVKAGALVEVAQSLPFWEEVEERRHLAVSFGRRLEKQRNRVFLGKKITHRVAQHQAVYRLRVVSEADHRLDLQERRAG